MKKRTSRFRRTNVYTTVLLSSLLPCVLATILLAVVFLPLMSQSAKKNDEAYEENLLYATASQFSDLFTSFDNAVAVVENNNWIHPLFLDAIIEKDIDPARRKTLQKELAVTCARSSFQQFSFMFYDMPALYADSGVKYDQQTYLENADVLDNYFFRSESQVPAVSSICYKGETYLLYQAPFRVVSAGTYRGEVNILVRSATLGKRLESAVGEDAVAFQLTNSEGDVLWEYTSGQYTGETVSLSRPSSNGQFCYCVEIPVSIHRQTREETVLVMVGTLVCSLGISMILCVVLSRVTYRPIQRLIYKFTVFEEKPNFEMLEQVVDGIIQEKVLMENSLERLRPIAHQKVLGSLLDGSAFLGDSEDQMESCGIHFVYEQFNVIALEAPFSQLKQTQTTAEFATEILTEALSSQLPLNAYLYYENSDHYRLVVNYDTWEALQAYLSLLTSNIKQFFRNRDISEGVYLGIGQAVQTPEDLYRAADHAETAMYMAIQNRLEQPMFYREMAPELNYDYFYPMSEELLLSRAIASGNVAGAKSVLYAIIDENRKNSNLNPKCLQLLYLDLSSTVVRSGQNLGVQTQRVDTKESYMALEEICALVEGMIDQICGRIMAKKSNTLSHTEQKILEYIDAHVFDPDLSLNKVGEAFQLSSSHISNIFREHQDTNFNNYVNRARISRALQLMAEEGIDFYQVYPLVGYTNLSTFRRNYSKFAKQNPGTIEAG